MYIQGLSEKISRDTLELTIEDYTGCAVDDIVYGLDPSVALVVLKEKPGQCTGLYSTHEIYTLSVFLSPS